MMRTRKTIGTMVCLALATAAFVPAAAQDRFAGVEIEATDLGGGVYMLTGRGGNIGASVGADGTLIIDDQFAPLADRIRAALAKLGKGNGKPQWILNTHWHGDHTGGNASFAKDGHVVAHENVRRRLASGLTRSDGRETPPAPQDALPVVTFNDELTLHFNEQTIRAFHLPHAHTDGDTAIWFEEARVAHLGDLFFAGRFPYVDRDSGGSVDGLISAIASIERRLPDDAKIIPGHGPLSTPADLGAYLEMLKTTRKTVADARAAGKSLEETIEAGFGAAYADWSWEFISAERWARTLWADLEAGG